MSQGTLTDFVEIGITRECRYFPLVPERDQLRRSSISQM